jgi:hypothetical protein
MPTDDVVVLPEGCSVSYKERGLQDGSQFVDFRLTVNRDLGVDGLDHITYVEFSQAKSYDSTYDRLTKRALQLLGYAETDYIRTPE